MSLYSATILYLFSAGLSLITEDAFVGAVSGLLLGCVCIAAIRKHLAIDKFTSKILSLPIVFGALYSFSWIFIYHIEKDLFQLIPFAPAFDDVYRIFSVSNIFFTFVACGYLATILLCSTRAKELSAFLVSPRSALIRADSDLRLIIFVTTVLTFAFGLFLTLSDVWTTVSLGDRGRVWDMLSESRFWIFHVVLVTLSYFLLVACFDPMRSQRLRVLGALVVLIYILLSLATGSRREIFPLLLSLMILFYRRSRTWFFILGLTFFASLLAVGLARLSSSYNDDVSAETIISGLVGEAMFSRVPLFASLTDTFSPPISLLSSLVSYLPGGRPIFAPHLADQFATWAGMGFGFAFSPDAEAALSIKSDLNVIFLPLYLLPFLVIFQLRRDFRPLMFFMLSFSFWRGDLSSSFGVIFLHSVVYYSLVCAMRIKWNWFDGHYDLPIHKVP